ncbi:MAG TPA: PilZ domain-containing protein [Thermodesulfovibrionales bacterium]|nr:PilZ domain-containing protein [Thermodesulfovibrionales bacterium]
MRRKNKRVTKRLEVTFFSGGLQFRGISSDLSTNGLFIRTQNGFMPGTLVEIEIYLPHHKVGRLKGIVRRTVKTSLSMVKNGMGVELIEKDQNYLDFVKSIDGEDQEQDDRTISQIRQETVRQPGDKVSETSGSRIIVCVNCETKNRIPEGKVSLRAKCGRCGTLLYLGDDD